MNCTHCGAALPEGSGFCNVCGKSQATGAYKIAEVAGRLGQGAVRAFAGFLYGAGAGAIFYAVMFSYTVFWIVPGYPEVQDYGILGGIPAVVICALVVAVACAIGNAASLRFACLSFCWFLCSVPALALHLGLVGWTSSTILGKIVYVLIMLTLLPLSWIWYMAKNNLLAAPRATRNYISTVKQELQDTAREVTRFGRR